MHANDDKLCLKEQVFDPKQEQPSKTETWKHRESEQKDREQQCWKRLKK
jgi:hypothetical protein